MSTTTPQLRPMSAGDILDQAIRIYRRNFVPLVTIVAIISVPLTLLQVLAQLLTYSSTGAFGSSASSFNPESFNGTTLLLGQGIVLFSLLLTGIGAIFQQGALSAFVSERFLGRQVTVRQAYGRAFRRWLSLLIAVLLLAGANVVLIGSLLGIWLVPLIGIAALNSGGNGGASAIGGIITLLLCCLILPAIGLSIFLNTRWAFFEQAIVLENYNSTGGLGRSWKLVKGTFWRVLGMVFVLGVIVYLFSAGPILLVTMGAAFLPSPIFSVVINGIASSLIVIVMTPLQYAALTILYYDLRIRKEGFDLQVQMRELPEVPTTLQTEALPALEPTAPEAQPSTSQEAPLDLPPLFSRDDYPPK